ncbi:hypothetical protein WA026_005900 [Henosepilachna vigintioctopunctata]|uniref:Uncharacterized protein n=1 Tax=Henosepilachna vigintioctopunctata TaxID=420089 RepID=A0AAW1U3H9_9CUCU
MGDNKECERKWGPNNTMSGHRISVGRDEREMKISVFPRTTYYGSSNFLGCRLGSPLRFNEPVCRNRDEDDVNDIKLLMKKLKQT